MKHVYYYSKSHPGNSVIEMVVDMAGRFVKDRLLTAEPGSDAWHWQSNPTHMPYTEHTLRNYPDKTRCKSKIKKYLGVKALPAPEASARWESPEE